jgi:CTP:molybdopterin cytidylyltransferase MocA
MCDQPHIMPGTISDLILKYRESGKKIGCIFYGKYYGSPAIFSKEYEDELESLTGDSGGKKIIKNHIEDVFFFYCPDDSEFKDYDYPGA